MIFEHAQAVNTRLSFPRPPEKEKESLGDEAKRRAAKQNIGYIVRECVHKALKERSVKIPWAKYLVCSSTGFYTGINVTSGTWWLFEAKAHDRILEIICISCKITLTVMHVCINNIKLIFFIKS